MRNEALESWIRLVTAHVQPAQIHWCDGSEIEIGELRKRMLEEGSVQQLNPERYPDCYVHHSDPDDALYLEHRTFISTGRKQDVGPTNHWMPYEEAYRIVWPLFAGAMKGRTMYVVPYLLGSPGSKFAQVGIQITDSPLVVAQLRILAIVGSQALAQLGSSGDFARSLHSLGDRSPERRYLVCFPSTENVWSIGSDCSESALLAYESHALRLASAQAPEEGYLAEHMSVVGITSPGGKKRYIAAAFPGHLGKTQLSLMASALPQWTLEPVAHDQCWLRVGDDGRLWALNPAAGVHSIVSGTNQNTHPRWWAACGRDAIFTNVAVRRDGTPWWEGSGLPPGDGLLDWQGRPWTPGSPGWASHPNARVTTSLPKTPNMPLEPANSDGVPISAILFGAGHGRLGPLVYEALSWDHGVYVGATLASETVEPDGTHGLVQRDPMAMLPFCAYDMATYFSHWLRLGRMLSHPPRIFSASWFQTDDDGKLLWPGFGENIRVLAWMFERIEGAVSARSTPVGLVPQTLNTEGLQLGAEVLERLQRVDLRAWLKEAEDSQEFLARFGSRVPPALRWEHEGLVGRLRSATN